MYTDILRSLREVVRRTPTKNGEPTFGFSFTTMLQHWSVLIKDFLAKNNASILKHPPYCPELDAADF